MNEVLPNRLVGRETEKYRGHSREAISSNKNASTVCSFYHYYYHYHHRHYGYELYLLLLLYLLLSFHFCQSSHVSVHS